jgi:hypothetical protein
MKIVRLTRRSAQRVLPAAAPRLARAPLPRRVSNANWGRLYDERPEFQFALVDDGRVLAEGNSIPVAGCPPGWRDALRDGFDRRRARPPLRARDPDRPGRPGAASRGRCSSTCAACAQRELGARGARFARRSSTATPLTPIERYAEWRREDGLLFDPWLRAHERLGAELVGIAPDSLVSEGTVAELEEWCGLAFPESGPTSSKARSSRSRSTASATAASYREPNVWMRHPRG